MDYFPPKNERSRIADYKRNEKIFLGDHFDAFTMRSTEFAKDYSRLKYVVCNFGGLLSKLSADMLFQEFPVFTLGKEGDNAWLDEVMRDNKFKTQAYESALEGSYRGDAVFRLRSENEHLIIEDINPSCYFPKVNENNLRAEPEYIDLAWVVSLGSEKKGLYQERHYKGRIENSLYQLDNNNEIVSKLPFNQFYQDTLEVVETGVDEFLVVHIPNYKINSRYFGINDYYDLMSLFFAINNRVTKIDNILDKHGDPILAVPDGFLDEEGKIKREAFGIVEVDTNEKQMIPQYIVWDAKLDSAFKEIEKLVEFLFMFSETSPSAFGLDKNGGAAESGRALKFKLLRTIAKTKRKQLYYDDGFKELFLTAQKFAKAQKLKTKSGASLTKEPQLLDITWVDGIINDIQEVIDYEIQKIKAGLSSKVDSIQKLDGVSADEAKERLKEIRTEKEEEAKANAPTFKAAPEKRPFGVGVTNNEVANNGK